MSHSCFVVAPNLQASQVSIKSSDQWSAESGRPFNPMKVCFSSHYRRSRCLLNRQLRVKRVFRECRSSANCRLSQFV